MTSPERRVVSLRPEAATKRRVLVVEDNLDSVHAMAMLIKTMGHEVRFAINGFAAMEVAREFRPDVILLDIGLPDLKGYEIARQLKWEPGLEKTRMIAISGRSEEELRRRAIDAGCEDLLVKPLSPSVLEELLARPQP